MQHRFVHRLDAEEGKKTDFDQVMLVDDGGKITLGNPHISGAKVSVKILAHLKDEKVLVFKKKRRKGYKKLNGHRQYLTQIQVEKIQLKAPAAKKTEEPASK